MMPLAALARLARPRICGGKVTIQEAGKEAVEGLGDDCSGNEDTDDKNEVVGAGRVGV